MHEPTRSSRAYRRYLLAVLLTVLAFNQVDRLVLGLVLQDIKVDLNLTDTQLGLLTGIAFALFYSVMGIPIARWADRGNRVNIISVTTALWSAAVALCGAAGSFVQLMLMRVGVAIGEAGCIPPAHSLIADHFTRAERPRATAIYMLGMPLSAIVGYFVGGWLNELYGWRTTFVVLGVPGLALAIVARFTLKEPRLEIAASNLPHPRLLEVWATLWASRSFRHLLVAFSVISFFGFGISKWQAAFFIRSHGMQTGELGTWFAAIFGSAGLLGTYLGGRLASAHLANNEDRQLKAMAAAFALLALIKAGVFLASSRYIAFVLMAAASVGYGMAIGPLFATIQTLVPQSMRATSIALLYLFANLIGMGLGPLAVGVLSDAFNPAAKEESLRYALLALCPGYLWGAWHLLRASRTVVGDVQVAQA
jgi:MFS transporter, Spinster family, sphingosine-1-phosphate transporter